MNRFKINMPAVKPKVFVFCEQSTGVARFSVEAASDGTLPMERAAGLLATDCVVLSKTPADYTILVAPRASLWGPVGQRAQELIDAGLAIECEIHLSPRKKEILKCILQSLSNKEIASQLNISVRTVKFHVSLLFEKFNVGNRFDLIRETMRGARRMLLDRTACAEQRIV